METAAEHYKRHEIALYIETVKGNKFYFDNPVFDIEEIAHALSMQCRYTGHTSRFYSVAEHSILVANILQLEGKDAFEGLMHDATEAYLSDIAAPWKAMLPDYKVMESKLELPMRRFYGLPDLITHDCKRADWIALFIEAAQLIPSGAKDWIAPDGVKDAAVEYARYLQCLSPNAARRAFLLRYEELKR